MNQRSFSTIRTVAVVLLILMPFSAANAASAVTVGNPNNPAGLQSAIDTAYTGGATAITITPGSYHLPAGNQADLYFHGYDNVQIIATGVDLAVDPAGPDGVEFSDCTDTTFNGATVHYYSPQTGQAKILDIGTDATGNYYDVQEDLGYPVALFRSCAIKVGGTTRIRPGTMDFGTTSIVAGATSGTERLYLDGVPSDNKWGVQVGDYVVCRGPGGMMLHVSHCVHCTFQNISIYWAGCFAYYDEAHGVANRYLNDTLTYGPAPQDVTNTPLLSESADSFHCADDIVGPDIENCTLGGSLDDGIAIHGFFYQIVQSVGNVITVGSRRGNNDFQPGDAIRIANNQSGLIADAQVVSVTPRTYTTTQTSQFNAFKTIKGYYDVTIDHAVPCPFDSLASDPASSGAGFKLINDKILDNRARGMLIKADDGLIQGCIIDGSTIAGIVVSPEIYWGEAGYSSNISIIGNTIRNTNYAMTGPWYPQAGGLTISGEGSMGQRNIRVVGNTFDSINAANIEVRWADGVTITNNRFVGPYLEANPCGVIGQSTGCDGTSVIWVGNSKNVSLSGNTVVQLGAAAGKPLSIDASANNITGMSNGLRVLSQAPATTGG